MSQLTNRLQKIINHWKSQNIELNEGASIEMITQLEQEIGFEFSDDLKELYLKVNGFKDRDWTSNMFSFFPLERIKEEYENEQNEKNFIPIFDYLIASHFLGYIKEEGVIYKDYEQREKVCDNILELIELIIIDSLKVY